MPSVALLSLCTTSYDYVTENITRGRGQLGNGCCEGEEGEREGVWGKADAATPCSVTAISRPQ